MTATKTKTRRCWNCSSRIDATNHATHEGCDWCAGHGDYETPPRDPDTGRLNP